MARVLQHSPGPWAISFEKGKNVYYIHPADSPGVVARVGGEGPGKENARLIASAPEMLRALRALLASDGDLPKNVTDMVRAAVAKAEGGTAPTKAQQRRAPGAESR